MSDIPQLEHALVEAARRRARRRFALPLRRLAPVLAAAGLVAVLVLVLRAAGGGDEQAATPPPPPVDVQDLVGRSLAAAQTEPGCKVDVRDTRMLDTPASAAVLDAFGVLRRPAGPGSRYPDGPGAPAGGDVLRSTVRRVTAGATPYLIAISRGPLAAQARDPEGCRARQHAIFDDLAAGATAAEIQRGHELLDEALPPRDAARADQEYLELFALNEDGTPNTGATLAVAEAARNGLFVARAASTDGEPLERSVGGVVPDGVAAVGVAGDGALLGRAAVHDNLVQVPLPSVVPDHAKLVFYGADRNELRRLPLVLG